MLGALIAFSGLTLTPPAATDDWVTLGEVSFFGQTDPDSRKVAERKVPIRFPAAPLPPLDDSKPHLEWGGWKIQINEWGNLGRVYRSNGGWDEFKALWEDSQKRIQSGRTTVWKCKAVLFKRTSVVYKSPAGVLDLQRGFMSDSDVTFCLETFARYKACVEAFTGGAVNVQITASIEDEPVLGSYENADTWSLHPYEAGDNYLRGRFNRGDFDCILYMYPPGTTRSFSFGGTIGRTNNATQAYVILSPGREGGGRVGHTEAMVHEWYHQVEDTYSKWGYGGFGGSDLPGLHNAQQNGYTTDQAGYTGWFSWLRDLMTFSVRQGMWAKLKNREEPDWVAVRSQTHRSDGATYRWDDVKDDPWAKLPYLTGADLAKRIGADSVAFKIGESQVLVQVQGARTRTAYLPQIDSEDVSLNNELNFGREAMAHVGVGGKDLIFARFDLADVVAAGLPAGKTNALGYVNVDSRMMVVFETSGLGEPRCELNALDLGSGITVTGPGEYVRGQDPAVGFAATAGARFSVTTLDGTAVIYDQGRLKHQSENAEVLTVVAAAEDGRRTERLFVVRPTDPIRLKLDGATRMSGTTLALTLTVKNGQQPLTAAMTSTLPQGWSLSGLATGITLGPGEVKTIGAKLSCPEGAADGPYRIEIAASAAGSPPITTGLEVHRFTAPTLLANDFEQGANGWDAPRGDRGGWTAKPVDGGVRGKALMLGDGGGTRWGRVNAFGGYLPNGSPDPKFEGYDVGAYPYLDFHLRTESESNFAIVVTLSTGKRFVAMITGPYQEQWGESSQLPRVKFVPNGRWQRIVYDLAAALKDAAGPGPHTVVDIGFGDSRQFSSNQTPGPDSEVRYVDDFRITRTADVSQNTTTDDRDEELSLTASPASPKSSHRARAAAGLNDAEPSLMTAVRGLIRDSDAGVRLNAATAYGRVKDPIAVPVLAEAFKLEREPSVSVALARALEFQDTPEAWAALKAGVTGGPEDNGRGAAAMALARHGDADAPPTISLLLASRSWVARREGAKALASIPTDAAQRMLMIFLMEVDPMVRIEVAKGAKPDIEPVGRRMEWGSINDLSNVVRGYDYAALTRSSDAVLRSRGYAGLKEPDSDIRRIIAEELGNDPREYHVQTLLGVLSDPNPEVRAAAVRSLLKMPGKRDFSEMSVLSGEDYEEVIVPLLEAAKDRKLEMPKAMLERLCEHRNETVRRMATELSGK
jgi:HEAT repeat protein